MPRPLLLAALALLPLVALAGGPAPAALPPAPEIAVGSVLRPVFTLADGKTFEAGTAFAADLAGETLILTAHHLFGPVGGLPAPIGADELTGAVKRARFVDAWSKEKVGTDTTPVRVPGAHVMAQDGAGDLAVFRLPARFDRISAGSQVPFHALPLAADDARLGDPVWLAASVIGSDARLHAATVVEVKPTFLFIAYAGAPLDLTATSGAPIVNAKGEVVGINLGGGLDNGKTIGAAGPVSAIRKNLAEAMKTP